MQGPKESSPAQTFCGSHQDLQIHQRGVLREEKAAGTTDPAGGERSAQKEGEEIV